jgi:F0F1-type ATP synthase membrane subunit b/b'
MLELDASTVLWQIVNFLVLFAALYFILFRPMMRRIREQAEEKARMMEKLKEDQREAENLREELEARLENAEDEAESIVERAKNQAEVERAELLQEAQAEVERILAEAQTDASRLKRQAIEEFHDELLQGVLDVSGLVIGRVAPEDMHESMVQQLSDSVWELGRSDMRRVEVLRRSLGERTPTVMARTAKTLSPEQQGRLVRTFSALADRNVNIDLKVEPTLGLGIQVRLGDLVMDNTIAGRLDELRDSVSDALKEEIAGE